MAFSGKDRALMGRIEERSVADLLCAAYREQWQGALRLTAADKSGTIWLVRGEVVHAVCTIDDHATEGMSAFESLICLRNGSYLVDRDVLPPRRSIRIPMQDLIAVVRGGESAPSVEAALHVPVPADQRLDAIFDALRQRVPGLETLSVATRDHLNASTASADADRSWIGEQLRVLAGSGADPTGTLYLKRQGRMLLVIGDGDESTILSASDGTSPEALFWAGEEACRRIHSTNNELVDN